MSPEECASSQFESLVPCNSRSGGKDGSPRFYSVIPLEFENNSPCVGSMPHSFAPLIPQEPLNVRDRKDNTSMELRA
jgi:hypothetical protein